MWRMVWAVIMVLGMGFTVCAAGVPKLINYSGKITDKNSHLLADGDYDMKFTIYNGETGPAIWNEEHFQASGHAVYVNRGSYNVVLGEIASLGNTYTTFNSEYYLEMAFKKPSDPITAWETFPRQRMLTAPYSMRSEYTNTAVLAITATTAQSIADNTVNSTKIADGTIMTSDIHDGAITGAKIADGAITTAHAPWAPVINNGWTNPKIACGWQWTNTGAGSSVDLTPWHFNTLYSVVCTPVISSGDLRSIMITEYSASAFAAVSRDANNSPAGSTLYFWMAMGY